MLLNIIDTNPIEFSMYMGNLDDSSFVYHILSCRTGYELDQENLDTFAKMCIEFLWKFVKTLDKFMDRL